MLLVGAAAITTGCRPRGPSAEERELIDGNDKLPEPDAVERVGGLIMTGRLAEGLALADAEIARSPNDAELHYVRGMALQGLGKGAEAIAAWEKAVALEPKLYAALDGIASVHLDEGRPDRALTYSDRALELAPDFGQGHFNRAVALAELGRREEAVKAYLRAAELVPQDGDPLFEIGMLYLTPPIDGEKASAMVGRLRGVEPDSTRSDRLEAEIAVAKGDFDAAIAALRAGIKRLPGRSYDLSLELIRVQRRAGKLADALVSSEALLAELPDQALVWSEHGAVLADLGKHDEAETALRRALELSRALLSAHLRLVAVLVAKRACTEAQAALADLRASRGSAPDTEAITQAAADVDGCGKGKATGPRGGKKLGR